jgi:hemerythrin-like domain-containing protein
MDPFELLKKDHRTVAELFERLEAASGKAKLGIFQQIKNELELHTHVEEVVFYPALEKANETRDLTLEAYEEHRVVKDLLGELESANAVTDEWEAKLTVLKENVEHHVDEEENELFDKANDVLSSDEAEALGDRMRAEKVKLGGYVPPPEEPGLLRKIANALGVGGSSPKPSQPSRRPSSRKKQAAKKAAKKSGKRSRKSAGSKLGRSSKASSRTRGSQADQREQATLKTQVRSSRKGAATRQKATTAKTAARPRAVAKKGSAAKKAGKGR